jgi:glycosyltransferase involved in cell wall biosynthesis
MHIGIVSNRFVRADGQGRVNLELAQSFAQEGHIVTCLAHEMDNRLQRMPGIEWVKMPNADRPISVIGNLRFCFSATYWLQRFGSDLDLIIANGANTLAATDINIVHFVHSSWNQSRVHDFRIRRDLYGAYQLAYSKLQALLEKAALKRADVIVAVSEKVRDELLLHGMDAVPIEVIHNGVDTREFSPGDAKSSARDRFGLPRDVPLGLFVGDIQTPRKGLDTVLQALPHAPRVHVAVAGALEESPYPDLARTLQVSNRTHFLGFRRDVPAIMKAADFLVFPSRYEACSLVLLEALGSGLPIITARTAGGAELVTPDAGIVLEDPDDLQALASALRQLATNEPARLEMQHRARAIAEAHTWKDMCDSYHVLASSSSTYQPSTL